ncbi:MAG: hypothetical protein KatS3mg080_1238 [Anoxybacillus sp.]|nr:MAG: hypothetical protein KatS3mg080_1238 [Anoxybacillus sp.]
MAFMVIVNLVSIFLLGRVAFAALQDYMTQRKQGKNPVFYARNIGVDHQVQCWKEKQAELEKRGVKMRLHDCSLIFLNKRVVQL